MKRFTDLPILDGTQERHAWEEWAPPDQLGSLNRLTPSHVLAATRLVRRGVVFSLDLCVDEPGSGGDLRPAPRHVVQVTDYGRDDSLDGFYLGGSSQWDGLRHVRYRGMYYGGRTDADLEASEDLGVDLLAPAGFVTRGVLVDVPRYFEDFGKPWDPLGRELIGPELLDDILAYQGVALKEGDVLLLRTGWLDAWLALPDEEREPGGGPQSGLDPGRDTAAWLWDHGIVGVAADNKAVERRPFLERGDGRLHFRLLPLLGIYMGEQFDLRALAADCAVDGSYEGMFTSAPLRVRRGVSAPPNAYLLK
jgi:hypothetical protein